MYRLWHSLVAQPAGNRAAFALGLAAGVVGAIVIMLIASQPPSRHRPDRFQRQREIIVFRAADMPQHGTIVLGDSIVERQRITELCGLPAFSAGISGAEGADITPLVEPVVALTKPARVVLAIGANDFNSDDPTHVAEFEAEMTRLAADAGRIDIIVGIPTEKPAYAVSANAGNEALRRLAMNVGAAFVEFPEARFTRDGLHLNADGRSEWRRRVDAACR